MKPGDRVFYFNEFGDFPIECEIIKDRSINYYTIALSSTQLVTINKGNLYAIKHIEDYKKAMVKYNYAGRALEHLLVRVDEMKVLRLKTEVTFCANARK